MREYSIPHLRRSGRISIPEESFGRIREARDLHKEGLATGTVRRMLREGSGPDAGELTQRLDHLHESLENLQGSALERLTPAETALPSPTLQTILARQSLLISAVFNLTEMVEELLLASGKRRKVVFGDVEDEILGGVAPTEQSRERQPETPEEIPHTTTRSSPTALPVHRGSIPVRRERFGSLRQRRRRIALLVLSALLVCALVTWAIPSLGERGSDSSFVGGREAKGGSEGETALSKNPKAAGGEASGKSADEGAAGTPVGSRSATSGETGRIEVPDISHRDVEEAARILSQAGLKIDAAKNEASQEEIGTLIGTEPPAGSLVEPGTSVALVLSGGPNWVPPEARGVASSNGSATQYGN